MSNIIETTAPISINELKKYFLNKELKYVIDYENSTLKGTKLLTYLSNLDLPCDITVPSNQESKEELLVAYFNSPFITSVPSLENLAMIVLFEYKGLIKAPVYTTFIETNKEIIEHWANVLDSLTLYNMHMIESAEFKDFAESFPHNDTEAVVGVNFVNMLKYPIFYEFYQIIKYSSLQFYSVYFTKNMFKGRSLYSYWANESNPLFLLTFGVAEGLVDTSEYIKAKQETMLEEANAALI